MYTIIAGHYREVLFMDRTLPSDKIRQKYFTTGEFAKICNVKKQTLFHYDDIGIFSPEIMGENGYRYYSFQQIEVFENITMLKELDMPLKEIKRYLDHRNPQNLITLLSEKEKELDEKIKELQWIKNYMGAKRDATKEGMQAQGGVVTYRELPEEYLVTTEYDGEESDLTLAAALKKHYNYCHALGMYILPTAGSILPTDEIPVTEFYYQYKYLYTKVKNPEIYPDIMVKPAGTYAVIYHPDGYNTAHKSYRLLMDDIAAKGFTADKYFYEDNILDELSMFGYENYMLKISVRVV